MNKKELESLVLNLEKRIIFLEARHDDEVLIPLVLKEILKGIENDDDLSIKEIYYGLNEQQSHKLWRILNNYQKKQVRDYLQLNLNEDISLPMEN